MENVVSEPIKLQTLQGKEWLRHVYEKEFCFQTTASGGQRICITSSYGYVDLLLSLSAVLSEPLFILYVLIVSRKDEHSAARYQSKAVSRAELHTFFKKFEGYLENDGRHHVWIHSPSTSTTLVYDNHNVIYTYGSLETISTILQNNGFRLVQETQKLGPHGHCYNQEFDACESELLGFWEWSQSPLKPEDDPREFQR